MVAARTPMELTERRQRALELRKIGYDYRSIAKALEIDVKTAYKDVNKGLAAAKEHLRETAEEVLNIELQRLDAMQAAIMPKALKGDRAAIETVLKLQERRSKYLGLDAAGKLEIAGRGVVINLTPADMTPIPAEDTNGRN